MTQKIWSRYRTRWQSKECLHFSYEKNAMQDLERDFLQKAGIFKGAYNHISPDEKDILLVHILSDEAMKTSEIEGEYLGRESVQESIKKNLGLKSGKRKPPPAEFGVAEMMANPYKTFGPGVKDQSTLTSWCLTGKRLKIKTHLLSGSTGSLSKPPRPAPAIIPD